jgi:hypothetical protein
MPSLLSRVTQSTATMDLASTFPQERLTSLTCNVFSDFSFQYYFSYGGGLLLTELNLFSQLYLSEVAIGLIAYSTQLTELVLPTGQYPGECIIEVLKKLPHLTALNCMGLTLAQSDQVPVLDAIYEHCPGLRSLAYGFPTCHTDISRLGQLRSLCVVPNVALTDFDVLARQLSKLTQLNMITYDDTIIPLIGQHCTRLERLTLSLRKLAHLRGFVAMTTELPYLREFTDDLGGLSSQCVFGLLLHCPKLTKLRFVDTGQWKTADEMRIFVDLCKRLRSLHVRFQTSHCTLSVVESLVLRCKRLRSLYVQAPGLHGNVWFNDKLSGYNQDLVFEIHSSY